MTGLPPTDIPDYQESEELALGDPGRVSIEIIDLSVILSPEKPIWYQYLTTIKRQFGSRAEAPTPKHILQDISADIPARALTGIIGASGSGKTSLLNLISGQLNTNFSGQLLFNGHDRKRYFSCMAYVMQDDFLIPSLTIRETLQYAVDLRLPFHNRWERRRVVERVITDLRLDGCSNTRIGDGVKKGCSGGEKRRTSIGVQLLANPSCLLLDEPTTGLDAASAYHVMEILQSLAKKGMTVIVSIHSPRMEMWKLLDNVMVLALGSVLYSGRTDSALGFFAEHGCPIPHQRNYAEHLVNMVAVDNRNTLTRAKSMNRIATFRDIWQKKSANPMEKGCLHSLNGNSPSVSPAEPVPGGVSFSRQLGVFTARTFKTTLRDPMGILSILFLSISLGAITGWTYFSLDGDLEGIRSRQSAFYSVTSIYGYLVLMYEIYRLTNDIRIFDREKRDWISHVLPFVLGRRIAKLPLEDLPGPAFFAVICYWMVGFQPFASEFFVFLLLVVLTNYIALTYAMLAVAISRKFALAALVGNMFYTLQSMAGGYLIQTEQIPVYVRWTKWITHTFYIFSAFCTNEFMGLGRSSQGRFYRCPFSNDPSSELCKQYTGKFIIDSLGIPENWTWKPLITLSSFFLIYQITAVAILHFVSPNPRLTQPNQDHQPLSNKSKEYRPLSDSTPLDPVTIRLVNLSLSAPKAKKSILRNISTTFEAGKLNAIMGPSGSGKTSLLNTVTGNNQLSLIRSKGTGGQILYNGGTLSKDLIQSIVSYVSQDDNGLPPFLTVREFLDFTARLRLPKGMSELDLEERVETVLHSMGLQDCAQTMIGDEDSKGISGGEKKRLSIALQLLPDPQILVLDEPTSGLDAFTAASILDVLNSLALAGRTIILSIHQPPSDFFEYQSNVLLLSPGGFAVYAGPCKGILPYFEGAGYSCPDYTNPADFIIDTVSIDPQPDQQSSSQRRVENLIHRWTGNRENTIEEPSSSFDLAKMNQLKTPRNPFTHSFPVLLRRSALHLSRQPIILFSGIGQGIGLCLFLMLFYAPLQYNYSGVQTIAGLLLQLVSLLFIGLIQTASIFPAERDQFYRDRAHRSSSAECFTLQYTALLLPLEILSSLILGAVMTFLFDINRTFKLFLIFSFNAFSMLSCSESVSMIMFSFVSHPGLAVNAVSLWIHISFTLSGIFNPTLPRVLEELSYIVPAKHVMANAFPYVMEGLNFTCDDDQRLQDGKCPVETGRDVLRLYNLDHDPMPYVAALGGCIVVYRFLAYLTLKFR
ncbi:hypothetical protein FQN54_001667 [Arachnomyces sp. PD_36]|nr:hypothetical protein FQN54_001667 [Arachnomyces sp. PD_36]